MTDRGAERRDFAELYSAVYQQLKKLGVDDLVLVPLTPRLVKGDQTAWRELSIVVEGFKKETRFASAAASALRIIDSALEQQSSQSSELQRLLQRFRADLQGRKLTEYPALIQGLESRWKQLMNSSGEDFYRQSANFQDILEVMRQSLSDRADIAKNPQALATIKLLTGEIAAQIDRLKVARAFSTASELSELSVIIVNHASEIDSEVKRKQNTEGAALNSLQLGKLVNRLSVRHQYFGVHWRDEAIREFALDGATKTGLDFVDAELTGLLLDDPDVLSALPDGFAQNAKRLLNREPEDGCEAMRYLQQVAENASSEVELNIKLQEEKLYQQYPVVTAPGYRITIADLPRLIQAAKASLHSQKVTESTISKAVKLVPNADIKNALKRIWSAELQPKPTLRPVQELGDNNTLALLAQESTIRVLADLLQRLSSGGFGDIQDAVARLSLQEIPADILTDEQWAPGYLMTQIKRNPSLVKTPAEFQRLVVRLVLAEMRAAQPERTIEELRDSGGQQGMQILHKLTQRVAGLFRRESPGKPHRIDRMQFNGERYKLMQVAHDLQSDNAGSWTLTMGRSKENDIRMKGDAIPGHIGKFRFDAQAGQFYFVPGRTSNVLKLFSGDTKGRTYKGLGPNVSAYLKEGSSILELNRTDADEALDLVIKIKGRSITITYPTK